ncbi:MAG: Metallo-beta-lactamase superfamily protein [Spirochaetes bacterium ADurb.Bin133]|jgi:glyoxylase-like metal-dependent hydrolase (beta-lactamase superfamily II)|nr:MAG: Metallo-beta-lactamase superfamily protein [Spirochaetes bacterium ADurb.Bin133]
MIDAGYNYDRLEEKMSRLNLKPKDVKHILITHQDTDHMGAVERDSDRLFKHATLYIGEIENRYLAGEIRRKVFRGLYKLPKVNTDNEKVLLKDGEIFYIYDIKIKCILVPGHTGYTWDLDFAFKYVDKVCKPLSKKFYNPLAPYDGYDESDDTEENARKYKI